MILVGILPINCFLAKNRIIGKWKIDKSFFLKTDWLIMVVIINITSQYLNWRKIILILCKLEEVVIIKRNFSNSAMALFNLIRK
jgi:hypothetical protein